MTKDTPAWALGLCYGGMVCLAMASSLTPIYFTTFSAAFHLTGEQLGRIAAVTFIGFIAGILLSAPLADRFGMKPFALLGVALVALGLTVLGLALNYGLLLSAAALMGSGAGVLEMVLSPIVSALRPDRRSSALNWLHSFYCVGAVATVLAGSVSLRVGIPWRAVALVLALFPAAVFLGFWRIAVPALAHQRAERGHFSGLLRERAFLAALACIFLTGGTEMGMAQWIPAFSEQTLGYGKATGALALAGFSLGMALGRILAGGIGHRMPPVRLLTGSAALTVAMYGAGCFTSWPWAALAGCMLVGFSGGCLWPTTLALAADLFPRGGAMMFAALAAAGNLGCFVMPWVIGAVADVASLRYALALNALCPALLILAVQVAGRSAPKNPVPPTAG